jgi:hypothetical protein
MTRVVGLTYLPNFTRVAFLDPFLKLNILFFFTFAFHHLAVWNWAF